MKIFLKVIVFSLITIGFFAGFSNFGVPRIEPAPPPEEAELDLGAMTMDRFIALGGEIYNGKGTCTLCHNALGRAPLLDKTATVAAARLKDARYKGAAKNAEEYLYESLVKPSVFVTAGFGKAGTNDTESPMPDVSGGAIGLKEAELKAVVAYLQDLAGAEVTVSIPTNLGQTQTKEASAPAAAPRPLAKDAPALLAQFTCTACHKVKGQGGVLGPDLSKIGATRDKNYLRRAILDPNAEITKGFVPTMPPNYGEQMYAKEVEMLVDYLAGLK